MTSLSANGRVTAEQLQALLDYDPETGIFSWRADAGRGRRTGARRLGRPAGTLTNGYVAISINYRRYGAHQLAWLYVYGRWPVVGIDHIDQMRSNNRISNLREATQTQNNANISTNARNTSGFKGVSYSKRRRRWIAKISIAGKAIQFGEFASIQDAVAAYREGALRHYGQFTSIARENAA